MMEARLTREMERNRSVLARARGGTAVALGAPAGAVGSAGLGDAGSKGGPTGSSASSQTLPIEEKDMRLRRDVTDEQLQMFEKDNLDMLKHYESTLDKVRLVFGCQAGTTGD
jgi:hypothetical protein